MRILNFKQYKKTLCKLQKQGFFFSISHLHRDHRRWTKRDTGEGHRQHYLAQVSNIHNYLVIAVLFLEQTQLRLTQVINTGDNIQRYHTGTFNPTKSIKKLKEQLQNLQIVTKHSIIFSISIKMKQIQLQNLDIKQSKIIIISTCKHQQKYTIYVSIDIYSLVLKVVWLLATFYRFA